MDAVVPPVSSVEGERGLGERTVNEGSDADAARMLAFRAGDAAAFDALFGRWFAPLVRYIDGMVRDAGRAEELAQEVFFRIHCARDRYEPRARFSTWMFQIATNLARNELRRPGIRLARVDESAAEQERDRDADSSEIEELIDARRRAALAQRALGGLSVPQREALWLSQVEGLPYVEVAEILDTTVGSVKMLVRRARLAMAEALGSDGALQEGERATGGSGTR